MTQQPDAELMELASMDLSDEKKAELLALFPEARIEGGKIDFDQLKRALGEAIEVGKERYGLTWPGKADCFKAIQAPSMGTLRPMREESVNFDETRNVVIEGDNMEVLKLMQKAYLGKVKMIYIDPPYNTGHDFIYPDDYAENLQTYLEYTGQVDAEGKKFGTNLDTAGRFHSNWLRMMYPRLYLARNLLRNDGCIFVTIDDVEVANLRKLMDEVFGEENFVAQVEWQKRYTRSNNTDNFTSVIDHILVYARSHEFHVSLLPRESEADARFTNPDNDPRGPWKGMSFLNQLSPAKRPNLCYPITNPNTDKTTTPTSKAWRVDRETFSELENDNRLYWGKDGSKDIPDIKTFLTEVRQGMTPINLWTHDYASHTDEANREIKSIFGEKVFDTPKPTLLIRRMLEHCQDPNALILDFFAGSGSTGHAVMLANKADGGDRRYILVQLPEETGLEDYPTISALMHERLRRCMKSTVPQRTLAEGGAGGELDTGFRSFRLATSGFERWDGDVKGDAKTLQRRLQGHVSHLKEDRAPEDVFFEVLLKSGFPLDTRVEKRKVGGVDVFDVGEGSLFLCLERKLSMDAIKAIAAEKPVRAVFLDEAFADDDQLKVNAIQTFKAVKPDEEKGDVSVFQTV